MLVPWINKLVSAITGAVRWFRDLTASQQQTVGAILAVAAALPVLSVALTAISAHPVVAALGVMAMAFMFLKLKIDSGVPSGGEVPQDERKVAQRASDAGRPGCGIQESRHR